MRVPEHLRQIAAVPIAKVERPSAARLELLHLLFGQGVASHAEAR